MRYNRSERHECRSLFPLHSTRRMTYDEAIAFWYVRMNFEVRSATPTDLKLERMRALLSNLGDPQNRLRIVHITGTKGKGSVAAMLAATLRAAGYRVGLFTSPHLVRVEERIQVNGVPISEAELAARMTELAPLVDPSSTFFEIATAVGFQHFLYRNVDIAIVEVGLGGRFDSTNVCTPLATVITSIGLDHTAQLGETLEEIAFQKAGIIKPNIPTVSGVTQPAPLAVIRKVAAENASRILQLDRDIHYRYEGTSVHVVTPGRPYPAFALKLLGEHQAANAAIVIGVVERLQACGLTIPDTAIAHGFANVDWPARIEVVRLRPTVVVDCAHNVPSAEALAKTLRAAFPHAKRRTVLFAVSSDKNYEAILAVLVKEFDQIVLTKYGNNPRCVPPEKLVEVLAEIAPEMRPPVYQNATAAWEATFAEAGADDLICIAGSVFLAGELRDIVRQNHEAH